MSSSNGSSPQNTRTKTPNTSQTSSSPTTNPKSNGPRSRKSKTTNPFYTVTLVVFFLAITQSAVLIMFASSAKSWGLLGLLLVLDIGAFVSLAAIARTATKNGYLTNIGKIFTASRINALMNVLALVTILMLVVVLLVSTVEIFAVLQSQFSGMPQSGPVSQGINNNLTPSIAAPSSSAQNTTPPAVSALPTSTVTQSPTPTMTPTPTPTPPVPFVSPLSEVRILGTCDNFKYELALNNDGFKYQFNISGSQPSTLLTPVPAQVEEFSTSDGKFTSKARKCFNKDGLCIDSIALSAQIPNSISKPNFQCAVSFKCNAPTNFALDCKDQ